MRRGRDSSKLAKTFHSIVQKKKHTKVSRSDQAISTLVPRSATYENPLIRSFLFDSVLIVRQCRSEGIKLRDCQSACQSRQLHQLHSSTRQLRLEREGGNGDEDLLDLMRKRRVLPSILHLFLSLLRQRCTLGKIE